jgi:Tol biopolymer transport system component
MSTYSFSRRSLLAATGIVAIESAIGTVEHSRAADNPPGKIAFSRNGNLWTWENGNTNELLNDGAASQPRWSPDGSQFVFVREGESFSDLYLRTVGINDETQLTYNQSTDYDLGTKEYVETSSWVVDPSWSISGVLGYASDFGMPYQVMALSIMNYPGDYPIQMSVPIDAAGNYEIIEGISVSGDGSVAAYTSRLLNEDTGNYVSYVGLQDLGSGEYGEFVSEDGGVFDPAMEPTGSRVAVAIRAGEITDIWLVDRDGGSRIQVTNAANASRPCWSSDGSWLAYYKMVDFKFEAWAVSVQGETIGEPIKLFNFDDVDSESGLSWFIG